MGEQEVSQNGSERKTTPKKPIPEVVYDEALVPAYTLPDPLTCDDGTKVTDVSTWRRVRRPQIRALFETHVYGRTPSEQVAAGHEVVDEDPRALNGRAVRRQVRLTFSSGEVHRSADLLMYLPRREIGAGRAPLFLGLNFGGNHKINSDPAIRLPSSRVPSREAAAADAAGGELESPEQERGRLSARWPVERIVASGFGLATVYCGDFEPDQPGRQAEGIRALFAARRSGEKAAPDEWGTIGAWAWGLSRVLDYLETDDDVDADRVAVFGHSRLGKTALWAGAQDERFALVISNDSGCAGAALSRRRFGETVERINTAFPHWFCDAFKSYNDRESELPMDQHMLLSLIAPRPLYVASAAEDLWADPKGEFLATVEADRVYRRLYGEGLPADEATGGDAGRHGDAAGMPEVDRPIHGRIGYHIRSGAHNITDYDWDQYLEFARRNLM